MKKGLQLYSIRDKINDAESFRQGLKNIAQLGFDGVELFGGYYGMQPEKLAEEVAEIGIEIIGSHVRYENWFNNLDAEIDYARRAGIKMLTFPFVPPTNRSHDEFRELFLTLNTFEKKCSDADIKMSYHNHQFEFEKMDGNYILDVILEKNPALQLEFDTFWAEYIAVDPIQYMKKYSQRINLVHIKDYIDFNRSSKPIFCAIGRGEMDNEKILKVAAECEVEWIIVEQDNSMLDTLESALLSVEALKQYGL